MSPYGEFRFNGLRWMVTRTAAKPLPSGDLPVTKRRWRCALPLVIICCLFIAPAQVDSFSFSGTALIGGLEGDGRANFFFSGPGIRIGSAFPDFPAQFTICHQNASCPVLDRGIPAASEFGPGF